MHNIRQRCATHIGKKPKNYIKSEFKNITSKGKDYVWATGNKNELYKCKKPCYDNKWEKVEGKLISLSGDDKYLWGINENKQIVKKPINGEGKWEIINGNLNFIHSSGEKYVWGIDSKDNIYKCNKPCEGKWYRIPGGLTQITSDDKHTWGINRGGEIFKQANNENGKWKRVNGNMKIIDASNMESIYGLDKQNNLYKCKKPCNGNWSKIKDNRIYDFISTSNDSNDIWGTCRPQPDINFKNKNYETVKTFLKDSKEEDNLIKKSKMNLDIQAHELRELINNKGSYLENIDKIKNNVMYKRNLIFFTLFLIIIMLIVYIKLH